MTETSPRFPKETLLKWKRMSSKKRLRVRMLEYPMGVL